MTDRIAGALVLVLGLTYLVGSFSLPQAMIGDPNGPRALPVFLAGALVLLGVSLLLARHPDRIEGPVWGGGIELGLVVLVMFVYAAVLTPLGYLLATTLFMLALLSLYNRGRWFLNAGVAVIFSVSSYYLFHKLLGVYVPAGLVG